MSVGHSETSRNRAELFETDPLIKVQGVSVRCDDRVKLPYPEALFLRRVKAMPDELFSDMLSPDASFNGKACVADVSAPSYIVRMKYVKPDGFSAVLVLGNSGKGLFREKIPCGLFRQPILLRKSNAIVNNLIPYFSECLCIGFGIFTNCYVHFTSSKLSFSAFVSHLSRKFICSFV